MELNLSLVPKKLKERLLEEFPNCLTGSRPLLVYTIRLVLAVLTSRFGLCLMGVSAGESNLCSNFALILRLIVISKSLDRTSFTLDL